jgi:hypothetical protein
MAKNVGRLAALVGLAVAFAAGGAPAAEPDLDDLLKRLESPRQADRTNALIALGKMSPEKSRRAIPELTRRVNPDNPPNRSKADVTRVLVSANALYLIGTKEAYDVVLKACNTTARRIMDAVTEERDPNPHDWELNHGLGTILGFMWPELGINVPPEKMTLEQLRKHVRDLADVIEECKLQLQTARAAIKEFDPNSVMYHYHYGLIKGLNERIPKLEAELRQARRLLDEREKEKKV